MKIDSVNSFEDFFIDYIQQQSGSISEYELMKQIDVRYPEFWDPIPNKESLYQKHFLLFHHLYLLQQSLLAKDLSLSINTLNIELSKTGDGFAQDLASHEPLSEFYLDKANLLVPESEVEAMLQKFWSRYLALDQKADAIRVLGLEDSATLTAKVVKARYQKLVQTHHPDKGGDVEDFRTITSAYETLKVLF